RAAAAFRRGAAAARGDSRPSRRHVHHRAREARRRAHGGRGVVVAVAARAAGRARRSGSLPRARAARESRCSRSAGAAFGLSPMDADPPAPGGLRERLRRRPVPERTSEVLRDLVEDGVSERITFHEILAQLKHRAAGFTLLIFALPCCLPMPPGVPTVCGIALVIIALNLIAARQRLWLPGAIANKSVARADLERVV